MKQVHHGGRQQGKTEKVREAVKEAIEQGKNVILPPTAPIAPDDDEIADGWLPDGSWKP